MTQLPQQLKSQVDDRSTRHMIAMINSMTPQERRFPDIIRGSRKVASLRFRFASGR
jgi:signal recognition particle subunit SRP54